MTTESLDRRRLLLREVGRTVGYWLWAAALASFALLATPGRDLNEPVPVQFLRYFLDYGTLDLGTSFVFGRGSSVWSLVVGRLPTTLLLVGITAVVTVLLGGLALAVRARTDGRSRRAVEVASAVTGSLPPAALFSVLIGTPHSRTVVYDLTAGGGPFDTYLLGPALALAVPVVSWLVRTFPEDGRSTVDRTRSWLGSPEGWVLGSYLLGGTLVFETAFDILGVGALWFASFVHSDAQVFVGVTMLLVLVLVVARFVLNVASIAAGEDPSGAITPVADGGSVASTATAPGALLDGVRGDTRSVVGGVAIVAMLVLGPVGFATIEATVLQAGGPARPSLVVSTVASLAVVSTTAALVAGGVGYVVGRVAATSRGRAGTALRSGLDAVAVVPLLVTAVLVLWISGIIGGGLVSDIAFGFALGFALGVALVPVVAWTTAREIRRDGGDATREASNRPLSVRIAGRSATAMPLVVFVTAEIALVSLGPRSMRLLPTLLGDSTFPTTYAGRFEPGFVPFLAIAVGAPALSWHLLADGLRQ